MDKNTINIRVTLYGKDGIPVVTAHELLPCPINTSISTDKLPIVLKVSENMFDITTVWIYVDSDE